MSLIHNERTKLTANWLDRAGTAAITVGVIAPLAAAVFGYATQSSERNLAIGVVSPLMLLATGLGVYVLTGWLDRREDRRTSTK